MMQCNRIVLALVAMVFATTGPATSAAFRLQESNLTRFNFTKMKQDAVEHLANMTGLNITKMKKGAADMIGMANDVQKAFAKNAERLDAAKNYYYTHRGSIDKVQPSVKHEEVTKVVATPAPAKAQVKPTIKHEEVKKVQATPVPPEAEVKPAVKHEEVKKVGTTVPPKAEVKPAVKHEEVKKEKVEGTPAPLKHTPSAGLAKDQSVEPAVKHEEVKKVQATPVPPEAEVKPAVKHEEVKKEVKKEKVEGTPAPAPAKAPEHLSSTLSAGLAKDQSVKTKEVEKVEGKTEVQPAVKHEEAGKVHGTPAPTNSEVKLPVQQEATKKVESSPEPTKAVPASLHREEMGTSQTVHNKVHHTATKTQSYNQYLTNKAVAAKVAKVKATKQAQLRASAQAEAAKRREREAKKENRQSHSEAKVKEGFMRLNVINAEDEGVQITVQKTAMAKVLMDSAKNQFHAKDKKARFFFGQIELKEDKRLESYKLEDQDAVDIRFEG